MDAEDRRDGDYDDRETDRMSRERRRIAAWLKRVRFRRQLFGGVRERDVWKKISELNDLYDQALIAERARYDALLEGQRRGDDSAGGSRYGAKNARGDDR